MRHGFSRMNPTLRGFLLIAAEGALFFHAKRVHPGWHKERVASIGNHVFFR